MKKKHANVNVIITTLSQEKDRHEGSKFTAADVVLVYHFVFIVLGSVT